MDNGKQVVGRIEQLTSQDSTMSYEKLLLNQSSIKRVANGIENLGASEADSIEFAEAAIKKILEILR